LLVKTVQLLGKGWPPLPDVTTTPELQQVFPFQPKGAEYRKMTPLRNRNKE
jgi:hypothetical protein